MAILLAVGVSCSPSETSPDPTPIPPPDRITGLITELSYDGEQLTSFVVESEDHTLEILIDPERDYGFDLEHLEEHRVGELPVQVALEARGEGLYAVEIEDA